MSVTAERTQWATRIWAVWQKSVDNIIETGRLLHAAKADPKMQHGEWGTMVESDLPFNRHTAYKLMQIVGDKRLTNVSPGKHLPPSWTTLYELTKLSQHWWSGACPCDLNAIRSIVGNPHGPDIGPRSEKVMASSGITRRTLLMRALDGAGFAFAGPLLPAALLSEASFAFAQPAPNAGETPEPTAVERAAM